MRNQGPRRSLTLCLVVAAGIANVPHALDHTAPLAGLPGHPQSAWKRQVLATLVERGVAAVV